MNASIPDLDTVKRKIERAVQTDRHDPGVKETKTMVIVTAFERWGIEGLEK